MLDRQRDGRWPLAAGGSGPQARSASLRGPAFGRATLPAMSTERHAPTADDSAVALSIRQAEPGDARLVLELTVAGYVEYRGVLEPESGVFGETVGRVRAWLERGGGFLASVGDEPAGCVRWSLADDRSYLYIGRLAVLPAWRGRGIAKALMAACERRASELGIDEVRIGVRIALPRLRAMYERLGYEAFDEEVREGYGPIATWMRRRLG